MYGSVRFTVGSNLRADERGEVARDIDAGIPGRSVIAAESS